MELNTWTNFEVTGKVSDYLNYKNIENTDLYNGIKSAEALDYADKNNRVGFKTTQYR